VSEVSEAELRKWEEGAEAEELGTGGEVPLFLPCLTSWRLQKRSRGVGHEFPVSFFL